MDHKREYPDYEAVQEYIRRARLERAVALGNLIADAVAACVRAVGFVAHLMQRGIAGSKPRQTRHA